MLVHENPLPPCARERRRGSAEKREDFAIFAISAHAQEARGGDVLHVLVSETPDEAQAGGWPSPQS